MKILLTNDLHGCSRWYDWLLVQATNVDIVAIAGDLFDGFDENGLLPQVLAFDRFVAALRKTGCCLAFSTGNHDGNIGLDADQMLKTFAEDGPTDPRAQKILTCEYWPDAFDFQSEFGQGTVVTDNRASILSFPTGERILVSTHPYAFDDSDRGNAGLWEAASKIRAEQRVCWLAIHHEPPADTKIGGIDGSHSLYWHVNSTPPNYVASGHIHDAPFWTEGSWMDRIGPTVAFNPGQSSCAAARFPNHVILDTSLRLAKWTATDARNAVTVRDSKAL